MPDITFRGQIVQILGFFLGFFCPPGLNFEPRKPEPVEAVEAEI